MKIDTSYIFSDKPTFVASLQEEKYHQYLFNLQKINYHEWLGKRLEKWEAACVFAQVIPKECARTIHGNTTRIILLHHLAQRILDILDRWIFDFDKEEKAAPLLWYANKALKERVFPVPESLLKAAKNYLLNLIPEDYSDEIKEYGYLARELQLEIEMPEKITQLLSSSENLPPYLNKSNPNFSPELKVAVDAWMAIYSNPDKQPDCVKKRLESFMEIEKIKAINNAVIKRISTVITPATMKTKKGSPESITFPE